MILYRENINIELKFAIISGLFVALALAYYPPGGIALQTIWHSFLFDVGHPIIGVDHLSFLIAFGVMVAFLKNRTMAGAFFIAASVAGTFIFCWQAAFADD